MKTSLTVSAVILALGAAVGWHNQQQIQAARVTHERLLSEASRMGNPADSAGFSQLPTKRGDRPDKESILKEILRDFTALGKEMEALEMQQKDPGPEMQERLMQLGDRIVALDGRQLKAFVASIRSDMELESGFRNHLLGLVMMTLSRERPREALAIFATSPDCIGGIDGIKLQAISPALPRWAREDPAGALEWVRQNGEKYPDLVTEVMKQRMVLQLSANDPKAAFRMIDQLGIEGKANAVRHIMEAVKTPEERAAALEACREYLAGITDEKTREQLVASESYALARSLANEGFESASRWIEKARLTPEELKGLAGNLQQAASGAETGRWIEWVGRNLPAGEQEQVLQTMISRWTRRDFQAAANWLNGTPPGPLKYHAIRTFAETVSSYVPEAAAQWALTLPVDDERKQTLRRIYEKWPKADEASKKAAEAFRAEHDIR